MHDVRTGEREGFPLAARARIWGRFERDLRAWLETRPVRGLAREGRRASVGR